MAGVGLFLEGKKVIVTGGLGYIGKHVVRKLTQHGAHVTIIDKRQPFKKTGVLNPAHKIDGIFDWEEFPIKISCHCLDITKQTEMLEKIINGEHWDAIIHLAAVSNVPDAEANPELAMETNVYATNFIAYLASQKNILFLNADSAMSPFADKSVYAKTKATAKSLINTHKWLYGSPSHNLTLYNVAGADMDGLIGEDHEPETHFIPNLVNAAIKKEVFKLDNNPRVKRDFVHVSDVARAFTMAIHAHMNGALTEDNYEVGTGLPVPLTFCVEYVKNYLAPELKVELFDSGRFEPYDYYAENGDKKAEFAANVENWVPYWYPIENYTVAIKDQFNFATKRILPPMKATLPE